MKKLTATEKKQLKDLQTNLKKLQADLAVAKKAEGIDEYVDVKVKKRKARFTRVKLDEAQDKAIGRYSMEIHIKAKQSSVFVPISIASGKKPTGFVYHIVGTGDSSITTASVEVGKGNVKQITVGTLEFCEIPPKETAIFIIQAEIKGKLNREYQIVVNRINYKLTLGDARYQQYLKPLPSSELKFK